MAVGRVKDWLCASLLHQRAQRVPEVVGIESNVTRSHQGCRELGQGPGSDSARRTANRVSTAIPRACVCVSSSRAAEEVEAQHETPELWDAVAPRKPMRRMRPWDGYRDHRRWCCSCVSPPEGVFPDMLLQAKPAFAFQDFLTGFAVAP
jgi:hypothetical protein